MSIRSILSIYWEKHIVQVIVLLVLGVGLLLTNLGDGYLWQDEAETALVSKTILTYGVPKGHDGLNSFSQNSGRDIGENGLWRWHPWLPFYITAVSFTIFDSSTFSARFPHALAGIGSVLLLYFLAFHFVRNRQTAFIAAILLVLSVAFLLLTTQARYYGLSILFTLGGFLGYIRIIDQQRHGLTVFAISAFLLIHTHYLYCATLFLSVLIYTLLFEKSRLKPVLTGICIISIINIPALVWYAGIGKVYERELFDMAFFVEFIQTYLINIHMNVFPWFLLLILTVLALAGWYREVGGKRVRHEFEVKRLLLPVIFTVTTIISLGFLAEYQYFRYLAPSIPLLFMIIAVMMQYAIRLSRIAVAAIFLTWLYTGDMGNYLEKLKHEYRGPMEGITGILNEFAQPGDTVAIPYGDLPVKFYTRDLHVIGAHDRENFKPAATAQWIIIRHHSVTERVYEMNQYLSNNLDRSRYQVAEIDFPDLPYQNREAPQLHNYVTPVSGVPKVRVLRRVN